MTGAWRLSGPAAPQAERAADARSRYRYLNPSRKRRNTPPSRGSG
jgi:hypothetical protein